MSYRAGIGMKYRAGSGVRSAVNNDGDNGSPDLVLDDEDSPDLVLDDEDSPDLVLDDEGSPDLVFGDVGGWISGPSVDAGRLSGPRFGINVGAWMQEYGAVRAAGRVRRVRLRLLAAQRHWAAIRRADQGRDPG